MNRIGWAFAVVGMLAAADEMESRHVSKLMSAFAKADEEPVIEDINDVRSFCKMLRDDAKWFQDIMF